MKAHYVGLLSGSWVCDGPAEGRTRCERRSGESGQSALRGRTRRPGMGDGADREPLGSGLRFGAAHGVCFGHMTQPLCERIACERAGGFKIPNCTPPATAYRRSFGKARLEEIAIKGERVAARFSNGELIDARRGRRRPDWLVHKVGGTRATTSSSSDNGRGSRASSYAPSSLGCSGGSTTQAPTARFPGSPASL